MAKSTWLVHVGLRFELKETNIRNHALSYGDGGLQASYSWIPCMKKLEQTSLIYTYNFKIIYAFLNK